jgi:hypothetical protein
MEAIAAEPESAEYADLRLPLHEELGRLPDRYRAPIVLCHLEGKTHEEAARLLRWPVGTVSGRLSRGRDLLKSRLERRGLTVPATILSTCWFSVGQSLPIASVESALAMATRVATTQSVSASVLYLAHGVLRTMLLNKFKTISMGVLLVGAVSGGVWAHWPSQRSKPIALAAPATAELKRVQNASSIPGTDPVPQSTAVRTASSHSPSADICPDDCPLMQTGDLPPYCPLTMAANAVSWLVSHVHGQP